MNTFQNAMREKDFVVTAELCLSPASTAADIRQQIKTLQPVVDAIQIGDNKAAEAHMAPLAAAAIAMSQNVDAVLHLTTRDYNRIALQSSLLGAIALGVSSLVIARGPKVPDSLRGKVKGVFDTQTVQLLQMAGLVSAYAQAHISNGFYLGSYAPVIKPAADWKAAQILEKISAGSKFLQMRPCLNIKALRNYMKRIVGLKIPQRAAVIVEMPLLTSVQMAREFKANSPGALVPERLIKRLAAAADPEVAGIEILTELVNEIASVPGVSGVNIVYGSDDDAAAVAQALRETGLVSNQA